MKRRSFQHRTAVGTLELIVALPVFLIFLAAIIEFGLIQANSQQVALSSRFGAKIAADYPGLTPANTAAAAATIRTDMDRQLESAEMGAAATEGITLRHTVAGGGVATDGTCSDPVVPAMPLNSVRITVRVPLDRLTPDLLNVFGFTISGKYAEMTSTFPYEQ